MKISSDLSPDEIKYMLLNELASIYKMMADIVMGDIHPMTRIQAARAACTVVEKMSAIYGLDKLKIELTSSETMSNVELLQMLETIYKNDKKQPKSKRKTN